MRRHARRDAELGSGLTMTMVFAAVAMATLAGALSWVASNDVQVERTNQYRRSVAAAEAATEKVVGAIMRDFADGGERSVRNGASGYRTLVPRSTESAYWANWEFTDASEQKNRTYVEVSDFTVFSPLDSIYTGLKGFITPCWVVSNARQTDSRLEVIGGVRQELQLTRIPVFQFAMFSSGDMEVGCGEPFTVSGRVHSNKRLYVEPYDALTFASDVTAVGDIIFDHAPYDTRQPLTGTVTYKGQKTPNVPALYLPIGTNNSPEAIRAIIEPAPEGESPTSPVAVLRYHNLAEMIITVTDKAITGTSGNFNGKLTSIPSSQLATFINTNVNFYDAHEAKTIRPVDISVGKLKKWSQTNSNLRVALGAKDVASVYVIDKRTIGSKQMSAVRVVEGTVLPSRGLTVATVRPLYVLGHFNQPESSDLGTHDTSETQPASLAGDSITILSAGWSDAASTKSLSSRNPKATTVNAAILCGALETTKSCGFGGGMHNFMRLLENWSKSIALTYNGSLIKMFPSQYATACYQDPGSYYNVPKRDFAFDANFMDPAKLPPLTPSLCKVIRSRWTTVAPNDTKPPAVSLN